MNIFKRFIDWLIIGYQDDSLQKGYQSRTSEEKIKLKIPVTDWNHYSFGDMDKNEKPEISKNIDALITPSIYDPINYPEQAKIADDYLKAVETMELCNNKPGLPKLPKKKVTKKKITKKKKK